MVKKIITRGLNRQIARRSFLKSAAALGVVGAFPAIITRRGYAADGPTVVNSIRFCPIPITQLGTRAALLSPRQWVLNM